MISFPFLTFLGLVSAATIVFSLFNDPRIRGFRNLGFLATYLGTAIGLILVDWRAVLVAWAIFGIASGGLYYAYELVSAAKNKADDRQWPSPMTIPNGLLMWPIMLPECIEYALADLGLLSAPKETPAAEVNNTDEGND